MFAIRVFSFHSGPAALGQDWPISRPSTPGPVLEQDEFSWVHVCLGSPQRGLPDQKENGTANHAKHAKGGGAYRARTMRLISRRGLPKLSSRQSCKAGRDESRRSPWLPSIRRGRGVRRVGQQYIPRPRSHRIERPWNVAVRRQARTRGARAPMRFHRLSQGIRFPACGAPSGHSQ
jgi:hypothetical protein